MQLLAKQLVTAMPVVRAPRVWLSTLNEAMNRFEINSPPRIAAFLRRIAYETNQCRNLEEDLSYSAAELKRLWPKRFPTLAMARAYERYPEKLANFLYANRLGNGPPSSRDGYRFRGRGLIRITGRANYASVGAALGLDLEDQPELLREPRNAAMSAAWFWTTGGLNELAGDMEDFPQVQPQAAPMPLFGAASGSRVPPWPP